MVKQWLPLNLSRMRLLQRLVPVHELFKPVEFGPRFSPGARAQSSSEGRIKLNIPYRDGCWIIMLFERFDSWFATCSAPAKYLSDGSALKLVVSTCCKWSPGGRFALFCGGGLLKSSICSVEISSLVYCSMMFQEVEKVLLATKLSNDEKLISMA